MGKMKNRDGFFKAVPVMKNSPAIPRNQKIRNRALIDKFLSFVLIINFLLLHPNEYDYPVFFMRTDDGDMFWKSQVLIGG